ncbi:MAG: class I mannose-6-phosphate isomerase [Planctomycetes bacterium]|nr:class I mannose-6-phosphate isomerase [Planctomycetota bacterium]
MAAFARARYKLARFRVMQPLRPVVLERRLVQKPWGGRALAECPGIPLPAEQMIGESWELYDRPDGSSEIREGGTLHELLAADMRGVLGARVAATRDGRFPLLLKFIDARERLSVQVHPGDEQARKHDDSGKSEGWVVLHAGPRASIVRGFRAGTTRAQVEAAAHAGAAIEGLLHSFTPKVGDVIPVPPGVVHAIGPDVVVFEVQQNSDLTFRFWDWGSGRELHVREALEAVRVGDEGPPTVVPTPIDARGEWLLRTPQFRVRRLRFDSPATIGTEGSYKVMVVVDGMAAIGWRSGGEHPPIPLRSGETLLVPAAVSAIFVSPIGPMTCFWIDGERG